MGTIHASSGCRSPIAAVDGPRRALRILLVEDNKDIARVLSVLLGRSGHRVTTAGGVAEAERAADAATFDLLISDLSLPDGSGLDLKRRLASLPGIALSGYGLEIDLRECLEAGFVDLLAKPVEFATLERAIRRVVG